MKNAIATLASQASVARQETRHGRQYLVTPVVMIRSGVLNGELVPESEIARNAHTWNGRPVVIYHPKDAGGNFVSAGDMDVQEKSAVGIIQNARYDQGKLKADAWIDLAKVGSLKGDIRAAAEDALGRIRNQQAVEVSTGYFRDIEVQSGKRDGIKYQTVGRNIVPDHLALLPNEVGACSVADGCGTPKANSSHSGCGCDDKNNQLTGASQAAADDMETGEDSPGSDESQNSEVNNMDENQDEVLDELEETNADASADDAGDSTQPDDQAQSPGDGQAAATETGQAAVDDQGASVQALQALVAQQSQQINALTSILTPEAVLAIRSAVSQQTAAKNTLVATLAANSAVPFTEDELKKFDMDTLNKLSQMATPVDYSFMNGGIQTNSGQAERGLEMPAVMLATNEGKEA